jgi:hypothetical protein
MRGGIAASLISVFGFALVFACGASSTKPLQINVVSAACVPDAGYVATAMSAGFDPAVGDTVTVSFCGSQTACKAGFQDCGGCLVTGRTDAGAPPGCILNSSIGFIVSVAKGQASVGCADQYGPAFGSEWFMGPPSACGHAFIWANKVFFQFEQ